MRLPFLCFLFCLSLWANTQSMFLNVKRRSIIGEAKLHFGWVGTTSWKGYRWWGTAWRLKFASNLDWQFKCKTIINGLNRLKVSNKLRKTTFNVNVMNISIWIQSIEWKSALMCFEQKKTQHTVSKQRFGLFKLATSLKQQQCNAIIRNVILNIIC